MSFSTAPESRSALVVWIKQQSTWRIAFFCAVAVGLVAVCFFAPRYWLWRSVGLPINELVSIQPEQNRVSFALLQLENPWLRIEDPTNRVIEWRLLFPLVGHYLHLPRWLYLCLPHLGCFLSLAAVATIAWRSTRDGTATVCAALLTATTSWFFVSTGWLAYFDSWLILALVLASFARKRVIFFGVALLAPWVDERFILALPICAAVRAVDYAGDGGVIDRRTWWRDMLVLLAGLAPYLAVRVGAELLQVRETSKSYWADRPLMPAPLGPSLWGVWSGLRLSWLGVAMAMVAWSGRGRWLALVAVSLTLLVNLCVADDISRSMSVAVPLVLAGVLQIWRTQTLRARRLLTWLCAGNLLLPAHHVIASPGSVEEPYHIVPILSLPAEWARADDPPYFASPFVYNRRGMDAFQSRDQAKARAAFDLALRFDPNFSRAQANRGILNFISGQREGGMAEMNAALQRSPSLYDARIQRAAFRQELGDLAGALDDVRLALRHMPADSPKRKDAEAFERALAGQSPR